jgi:6-phospho-3-hexuloisomerase
MQKQNSCGRQYLTNKCNKTDFGVSVSRQYAGSLFEQFTLFILEVFLWPYGKIRIDQRDLWPKHANLE